MLTSSEKLAFNFNPAIAGLAARALQRQAAASINLIFAILAELEDNLA